MKGTPIWEINGLGTTNFDNQPSLLIVSMVCVFSIRFCTTVIMWSESKTGVRYKKSTVVLLNPGGLVRFLRCRRMRRTVHLHRFQTKKADGQQQRFLEPGPVVFPKRPRSRLPGVPTVWSSCQFQSWKATWTDNQTAINCMFFCLWGICSGSCSNRIDQSRSIHDRRTS